ncbi:unnamed protein product [Agarophyton chilense]|eukprot:gb/GEZJ01001745.1/.p1 GENE.gb/GEZJ01001745.1/~~gb/GEZJ01001745.1/.p1  ORF type:complete len:509 (+),score=58.56 gb/GEZJ01001745.1/:606-2132(+)
MITVPIDSKYVNAVVYIVIDVFVFAVLAQALISFQSWITRRRLLKGERVTLREFRFSHLAGGVVEDGNRFSTLLFAAHLSLLGILFSLALGINGRTDEAKRPATREFISTLDPRSAPVLSTDPVFPQIMSSCANFEKERLTYFQMAFNALEPFSGSSSARHLRREVPHAEIGTIVNSESVLCQQYDGAIPLLNVSRCGIDRISCCNLSLSRTKNIHLQAGKGGSKEWQKNLVHLNESSTIVRRNVRPESYDTPTKYDRFICLDFGNSLTSSEKGQMNCMIGSWNDEGTSFTFRLGTATFPAPQRELIFRIDEETSVSFKAFTVETEIEWNANGEIALSNGLYSIGGHMIPVRFFLDTLVSRSSMPMEVGNQIIYEKYDMNVTDVSIATMIGYVILIVLALLFLLAALVNRVKNSVDDKECHRIPDITTYSGLLVLLQGDESRQRPRKLERPKVEFGITSEGSSFVIGPVDKDAKVVTMVKGGILRWHRGIEDVAKVAKDDDTLSVSSS